MKEKNAMIYRIVVNGTGHAFLREFGCPCDRCNQRYHVANTSASIIGIDETSNTIAWHALVDVGLGVVTSLCELLAPDEARLDRLLFTHWHPDHSLELNRLCETLRRSARHKDETFTKIPTWCRKGTAQWLKKTYSYEWYRCLEPHISDEAEEPGVILETIPTGTSALKITPISVSHYSADIDPGNFTDKLHSVASFVIETECKKAVLLWDIDNTNDWIMNPISKEQQSTVALLSEADYLFIDCFTWNVEEVRGINTGHTSFSTVKRYVRELNPRETLLLHLSGHEEGKNNYGWGWPDWKWQQETQKIWKAESLPGMVRIPTIGEQFDL